VVAKGGRTAAGEMPPGEQLFLALEDVAPKTSVQW